MKSLAAFLVQMSLLWGLLMAPTLAAAVEMKGLYQVSVAVKDRSDAERQRAITDGFDQVLIKVTGDSSVVGQDPVVAAAADAERYMLQYGYETRPVTSPDGAGQTTGTFINIQYDPVGINNFLRRSGLPIWATNRPPMLVWMAWEQGLDRELVNGSGAMPGPFQQINDEAKRRGVPLEFPVFDNTDQSLVSIGDIWGLFSDPVLAASKRYQTPIVLEAKAQETQGGVQINALLTVESQQFLFQVNQPDSASALHQLMDQVVDKVGAQYALVTSSAPSEQVVLQVQDVTGLNDFAALNRYLDSLLPVSFYRLQSQQGEQVTFLITLSSSLDALEQSLRVDRKLVPDTTPQANSSEPQPQTPPQAQAQNPDTGAADNGVSTLPAMPPLQGQAPGPVVIRYRWRG